MHDATDSFASGGEAKAGEKVRRGAVAAATSDAARAGMAMLARGGNAMDAACAAAWALGVCEPAESGLGGQTSMLVRRPDGTTMVIDGHSRAPAALRRRLCKRRAQSRGATAMVIPSTPITLATAQRLHGVLPVETALEPAIRLAEEGYRITALQRRLLKWSVPHFQRGCGCHELFLRNGRKAYRVGEIFCQPMLAKTLRRLARDGVEDLYRGAMARELAADVSARGGFLSETDLMKVGLPVMRQPLSIEHADRVVLSAPPPGGGGLVLLALQILWHSNRDLSDPADWAEAVALATRVAFRERERWPDHPRDFSTSTARWMVSRERAIRLAAELFAAGEENLSGRDTLGEGGNTTHLCAADADGMIVSLTQSIQSVFGAKTAHPTLGFVYNNYLSTCPRTKHPYRLAGRCLPQSNAAPTLVLKRRADGTLSPRLCLGGAGSRRITSSLVQVISGVLDRGLSLSNALEMPRVHPLVGGGVWIEEGIAGMDVLRRIQARLGRVRMRPAGSYKMGAVQAIGWTDDGAMVAAGDPRRDGVGLTS